LSRKNAFAASLVIALLGCGGAPVGASVLHTERSLYRDIVVYEEDGLRCMRFGKQVSGRQSCQSLREPQRLVLEYTRMMAGALYMNPAPARVLVIGLGGGSLPSMLQRLYPGIAIDIVEIDPAVVRVARRFFGFTPGPRTRVHTQDGRVFVKRMARQGVKYDLVLLDAFDHEYIPEHLLTQEFLQELRGVLTPGGVLAANTFSGSRLYDHESVTYYSVFGDFYGLRSGNRVILTRVGGLPALDEIERNAAELDARLKAFGVDSEVLLPLFRIERSWPEGTRVLTDQYSPSNLLNGR
jgi:Spermidine synthase